MAPPALARSALLGLLAACVWLLAGCASEPVSASRVGATSVASAQARSVLTGDGLSSGTRKLLSMLDLDRLRDRDEAVRALERDLEARIVRVGEPTRVALAELYLERAGKARGDERLHLLLSSAMHSYEHLAGAIEDSGVAFDARTGFALELYRRAVGRFARLTAEQWCDRARWDDAALTVGSDGKDTFSVGLRLAPGEESWDPSFFDRLSPADQYRISGVRNHHRVLGLGAPLIAERDQNRDDGSYLEFFPPEGIVYPVTLVLRFEPRDESGTIPVTAAFYDLLGGSSTELVCPGGTRATMRLAADLTAPLGLLWSRSKLQSIGHSGMLNVSGQLHRIGLYMLEPYRPNKIPVLMIHGLRSSPITWRDAFNDLRGDARIRENFQFWFFMYPTGLPVPSSAAYLRDDLARIRGAHDPAGASEALGQMVVVGHSMGGLLTKTLIKDPGDLLWSMTHDADFETLELTDESREHLERVFFYEPDESVARAVFIATPHRGAAMADSVLGRLGKRMVDVPEDMRRVGRELRRQRGALGEALRNTRFGVPTSIHNLSPDSPFLAAYNEMPFEDVPRHSIVGDRGDSTLTRGRRPVEETSDGVVAYTSSSLEGVESQLVVPAPHNAHEHPLAIEELRRILYEHLDELGRD